MYKGDSMECILAELLEIYPVFGHRDQDSLLVLRKTLNLEGIMRSSGL